MNTKYRYAQTVLEGDEAVKIISGIDVEELIRRLNVALTDEWLAYYQYWLGAKVATGPNKESMIEELEVHAKEELDHANKLADRIVQLRGTPVISPKIWFDITHCGFSAPTDTNINAIVQQNLEAERCAIRFYKDLMDYVKREDKITFQMLMGILKDELEHEEDLQNFLE